MSKLLGLLLVLLGAGAFALAADYPIGFVSHYPMVVHEDEKLPVTGANVCIIRAPWTFVEPEEDKWEFGFIDQQLEWAHKTGMQVIYVLEAGPAHAGVVKWLVAKLKAQGETNSTASGKLIDDPCYQSETYRFYLSRYIRKTVEYLSNHKYAGQVYGYNNGCEWWHPLSYSYAEPDKAGFREWLRDKYGSLGALNRRWGSNWPSWETVEPPVLSPVGVSSESQGQFLPASASCDVCWCTTGESHIPVVAGQKLTFELDVTTEGLTTGSAGFEITWLTADDPLPFKIDQGPVFGEPNGSGTISFSLTVPERVARAWLLPKLRGTGKATFHAVRVLDEAGHNLAPNPTLDPAKGDWQFIAWTAGEPDRLSHSWDAPGQMTIEYRPDGKLEGDPQYPLAVVDDWFNYRYESFAKFIDWMAAECRAADPNRPVITYLTFAFANPFEWDYTQQMAISLDYWAENANNQAVLGMQLNSSEGDFDSVTAAFDMVRRFDKPMWAIDLLDFTKGTYLGEAGLTRTSRSVVQHGGADSGIQYYCWYGTPDYNYAELGVEALARMIASTKQAASQLEGAKPVSEIALVEPVMPLFPYIPQPANDWADYMGWYKLLTRAGVCPDVYTLHALESADLAGYKAVVIPDSAYLTREALLTLDKAASAGVKLIGSGRFGLYDMTGRKLPAQGLPQFAHQFEKPIGKQILGQTYRLLDKGNTPPRLICKAGSPNFDLPQVDWVLDALRQAGVRVLARPTKATATVTLTPFQKEGKWLVFALPQSDWSGPVTIEGRPRQVDPLGSIFPLD